MNGQIGIVMVTKIKRKINFSFPKCLKLTLITNILIA
jgi:hypothetical protein